MEGNKIKTYIVLRNKLEKEKEHRKELLNKLIFEGFLCDFEMKDLWNTNKKINNLQYYLDFIDVLC